MPGREFITGVAGVKILNIHERKESFEIQGHAEILPETACPKCDSKKFRIKATNTRFFKHGIWNRKLVWLKVKIPKLYCRACMTYFTLKLPGTRPKKRSTEQFRQSVFELHQGGLTQTSLKGSHRIATATVERWYQEYVGYRVAELSGRECPQVLGIDEHFFTRKDGFATTLVDLKNHKVFDVVLGRSEKALEPYLKRLPGRDKVKIVVMDLSETYRSIVKKYFPNALIVADRFHVVRLLNQQFLKIWRSLDPIGKSNRGLLSLIRRHEWNLDRDQKAKLAIYFEEIPGLEAVYRFKQDLMILLLKKHQKKSEAKALVSQLFWHVNECLESSFEPIKTFGSTLKSWLEPIARMWRFTKNNGITEGFHTKMEMISRRAFGFRNFRNYRLRVIALCGWDGIFTIRS